MKIQNKPISIILTLLLLGYIVISSYFIYTLNLFNNIENFLRYNIMIMTVLIMLMIILSYFNNILKNRPHNYIFLIIIMLILGSCQLFIAYNLEIGVSSIDKMNKKTITYSTNLITLVSSNIKDIQGIKNLKIGMINDKNNLEGYVISKEIIKDQNLKDKTTITGYDSFITMLTDLYNKKLDAVFVPANYSIMFSSIQGFENIKTDTKIIFTKNKQMAKQEEKITTVSKKLTEPFTMLLLGVDSEHEGLDKNAAFNGDSLMVLTFNPKTLNATVLSIPRDTYVPIMCFRNHIENKITHSAWYGASCVAKTIENFTGIKIDYYVKINFKGVVKLVDSLGGIEVDVPANLCTSDSSRGKEVCVKKGFRTINGEQALVLSRDRHDLLRGDIDRGLNQQLVIEAIMNKAKKINSLDKVYSILDTVSSNMDTNLTTNQILSFYSVTRDIMANGKYNANGNLITMQQLFLDGYGQTIWDEGMGLPLWDYIYYRASLKEDVDAMKVNLGLKAPTIIKTFSFSSNNPYIPKEIGQGPYKSETVITLTPNFTSNTKDYAIRWGSQNNITIHFDNIKLGDKDYKDTYRNNQIISQSVPVNYRVANIKTTGITLKIIEKSSTITPTTNNDPVDCTKIENSDNTQCQVPNMIGWTIPDLNTWMSKFPSSITNNITITPTTTVDPLYNGDKAGQIYEQSQSIGTKIIDISKLIIKYYEDKQ